MSKVSKVTRRQNGASDPKEIENRFGMFMPERYSSPPNMIKPTKER
jgi:hypothetical protein